jgi:alkylhydroperoxidase family enzyme
MARIAYPDTNALSPELRELLKKANLNVFTMWAHSANTIGLIMQLGAVQFAKLELPRSIRELVTLFGARANAASYEWAQHVALSAAAGVTDAQRAALERGQLDPALFNPQEMAALQFAAAVEAGPTVSDSIFNTAREHFSDRQLVEMVGIIGYYWMLGRVATVFQVDIDVAKGTAVYDAGMQVATAADK